MSESVWIIAIIVIIIVIMVIVYSQHRSTPRTNLIVANQDPGATGPSGSIGPTGPVKPSPPEILPRLRSPAPPGVRNPILI
jgi:hypothetical protein